MTDELKLFGEVGLGYGQLEQDAEQINSLITSIDRKLKELEKTLSGEGIKITPSQTDAKKVEELSKAIGLLNDKTTESGKIAQGLTKDFDKMQNFAGGTKKKIDELNKAMDSLTKNSNLGKIADDMLKFNPKDSLKELEDYFKSVNKIASKDFNLENVGKELKKGLAVANEGTEEFSDTVKLAEKYIGVANVQLEAMKSRVNELSSALSKMPSQSDLQSKFEKRDSILPESLKRTAKRREAEYKETAKYAAMTYTDEFGRVLEERWQKLEGKMLPRNIKILKDPTEFKAVKDELKSVEKEMSSLTKTTDSVSNSYTKAVKRMSDESVREFEKTKQALQDLGEAQKAKHAPVKMGENGNLAVSMTEIYAIKKAYQELTSVISDYERKQIEVERIARNTPEGARQLERAIFDISKATGTLVSDTQEVAALWARTGKTGEQLRAAMETTMVGFNVAEFKDAESAVASMNAIINQMYNGNAQKAPEILDSLVKVADKTAVRNVEDLAEVASRAGANAASLKMNLHELNSVSSIIMENMKVNGDVLGNQLKTVFSRMLNAGNIDKLRQLGVEMTKTNENGTQSMKDFKEAFGDVVRQYNEFMARGDEVSANKLTELIGGTRYMPVVKNLIKDWDMFGERVALSMNSAGFAMEQNENVMESFAKKVEALKASWVEFIVSVGNGGLLDALKMVADAGKGVLEVFTALPDGVKSFVASAAGLSAVYVTLLKVGSITMRKDSILHALMYGVQGASGGMLFPGIMSGINMIRKLDPAFDSASKSANVFGSSISLLSGKVKTVGVEASTFSGTIVRGLGVAMGNAKVAISGVAATLGMTMPVFLAATAAVGGLTAAYVHHKNKVKEASESIASGKLDMQLDELQALEDSYEKLKLKPESLEEGTVEYERLTEVQRQLAEALGISEEALKRSEETSSGGIGTLKLRIGLKKQELEVEKEKALILAKEDYENKTSKFDRESILTYIGDLKSAQALEQQMGEKLKNAKDSNASQKVIQERTEALTQAQMKYKEQLVKTGEEYANLKKIADQLGKGDDLDKLIKGAGYSATLSDMKSALEEQANSADESADATKGQGDAAEEAAQQNAQMTEALKEQSSILNSMQSALDEYNSTGEISAETVVGLVSQNAELANCIQKVGDKYVLTEGFLDKMNQTQDQYLEGVDELINANRDLNSTDVSNLEGNITRALDVNRLTEFENAISSLDSSVATSIGNLNNQFSQGEISATQYFSSVANELEKIDFSSLSTDQIMQFSNAIQSYLQYAVSNLSSAFQSGQISQSAYSSQLQEISNRALQLYTSLNNLSYVNGNWVDSSGNVNEYANQLQNVASSADDIGKALGEASGDIGEFNASLNEAGDLTLNFDGVTETISGFADDFVSAMTEIKNTNSDLWDQIVSKVVESTGMTVEEAENALLNVGGSSAETNAALNSAIQAMMYDLVMSTNASGKQTTGVIAGIGKYLKGTSFKLLAEYVGSTLKKSIPFTILGKVFNIDIPVGFGIDFNGRRGKASKAIASGSRSMSAMWAADGRAADGVTPMSEFKNVSVPSFMQNRILPRNTASGNKGRGGGGGGGRGRGGGGRGSGGSKKTEDIPERIQKQIDDLKYELDMGRMDQYQYAKELEKILSKNKRILTEKGIREIEKMVYSSKTGGVKDGFKANIEEMENLVDLANATISSLEAEKKMIDTLKMPSSLKIQNEKDFSKIISGKITLQTELIRKYNIAISEINKELQSLDKTSVGYQKTVENLNKLKSDYSKKVNQLTNDISKLKTEAAQAAIAIYELKQSQINEAFDEISTIERHTIDMINARNDKIKERMQDRHKQEMEDLQKANEARDKSHRKQMDRIQREADAFRRYMEDKMKMLNREYAKDDFDEEHEKRLEEIAELKNQIRVYSLDDSYKAKGDVIKLRKELNTKEEELQKFLKNRERTITQEALQDQLTEYDRSLQDKQKMMNDDYQLYQEKTNNELELLRKQQEAEMKALEETMNARAVAMEAAQAMRTGMVKNINGQSENLRDAIIHHMQETGQWAGITAERYIQEFDAAFRHIRNNMQLLGLGGKDGLGSLQQRLGLTDDSFMEWKYDVSKKTGIHVDDVERYVQNKMDWEKSSPEERKRLAHENHLIRKRVVDANGGDQSANLDKNGEVFHYNQLLPDKEDKRWNFIQDKPRFAPYGGMTQKGSRDLFYAQLGRTMAPEKSPELSAQIQNIWKREPAGKSYSLGDLTGYKMAGDLGKIGKSKSILDIPTNEIETKEIREVLERQRREIDAAQNGWSSGSSGGSGSVNYDKIVDDIMGNASQQKKNFIRKILPKAMEASKKYNINLSALLGQASIESGWGTSRLARQANALFGIKHTAGYKQSGAYRAYSSWDESIEDYAKMISGNGGKGLWAKRGIAGSSTPEEHLRKLQHGGPAYAEAGNYESSVLGAINSNNFRGFENVDTSRYATGGGGGDDNLRERFLSAAKAQDGMPYSQGNNRTTTHRDCSSYVYFAAKNSGLYSGDVFYTGDMRQKLAKDGWKDLGRIPKNEIKRGDIFWIRNSKAKHTEIATQDGTLSSTGAHKPGKPAGPSSWIYDYHILRHPKINSFRDGGIIDYTGLANVHGSATNPEYVFNTPQFEALGKLVAKYAVAPSIYAPRNLSKSYEPITSIQIENLVQINGNADKETAREVRDASNDVLANLTKALRKRGK